MKIVEKENVYSGFLKLTKNKIQLNNGEFFDRELVLKNPGVAIVAVTKDNRIYLTKQPRAGAFLDESIEIPAGIIEGENVIDAAKRELLEETGCVAEKIIELGDFYGDISCCTGNTYMVLALNVEKVKDLKLDDDEFLVSYTEPIEKVYEMLENGVYKDAHTNIALHRAKKYLNIK